MTAEESFQAHAREILFARLRIASLLVVILTLGDGVVMYLFRPEDFQETFWPRTLVVVLAIGVALVTRSRRFVHLGFPLVACLTLALALDAEAAVLASGGASSPYYAGHVVLLVALAPLFPIFLGQMALLCGVVWAVYVTPLALLGEVEDWKLFSAHLFFLACASAVALTSSYVTVRLRRKEFLGRKALEAERRKSERLLLNILPAPIAKRLKEREQAIADSFDDVTVLFADIVGFTPLSESVTPKELVDLLNEIFSSFDELAERHGLEKIKTIGDAYMAAGGLPEPRPGHDRAVAEMALEMRARVAESARRQGHPLEIRIGLHAGPVVAGVIGRSKFVYDLWGDTVNTASRMESSGVPGEIQVTEDIRARLAEDFVFEERGEIEVKGKGRIRTFLLVGHSG